MATVGIVDLVIANIPEDLHIPGFLSEILEWNVVGDMYDSIFCFISKYLNDDGRLILLIPIGLLENLEGNQLLMDHGFEISIDWLCHQPIPLAHPNYKSKLVSTPPLIPNVACCIAIPGLACTFVH